MKIIKKGNAKEKYPQRVVCHSCKSTLEVEEGDVVELSPKYDYSTGNRGVTCPVCKAWINVKP